MVRNADLHLIRRNIAQKKTTTNLPVVFKEVTFIYITRSESIDSLSVSVQANVQHVKSREQQMVRISLKNIMLCTTVQYY